MSNIEQIDKNFKIDTNIKKEDIIFYDVKQAPFKIYGVFYDNGKYRRMPEDVAKSVSAGVLSLHAHTAGGRVRFKTNSPYVAISVKTGNIGKMPHFAMTGSAGFDMYGYSEYGEKYTYKGTFTPPFNYNGGYESVIELGSQKMRTLTINFPLYSEVRELYIGLSDKAVTESADDYMCKAPKPFVYYGSSITQGGCASRPGRAYQSVISRRFDADFINLGFSGNAKGEDEIADYIKQLPMSVFVFDYDHNAPTAEHLKNTHERMFKKIRESQPELPIIIMTRPRVTFSTDELERIKIAKTTCDNAVAAGDKNVYFISGEALMKYAGDEGTVDNCHPTDFGFASMAQVLGDFMEENRDKLGI